MLTNMLITSNEESKNLTYIWNKLKSLYNYNLLDLDKKNFLKDKIDKYGYLPMPHIQALDNLSEAEVLFGIEEKLKKAGVFKENKFNFKNNETSVLKRNNVKNSNWIKKEQHNIKLINLAGLGNGNKNHQAGKFIDWLRQLLILPTGNLEENIFSTTIYLIPFHPREFGCAYLPNSSDVSPNLEDKKIKDYIKLNAKSQVQLFIKIAQLASHPVIYDILLQTGRFSKIVLVNPACVRWFDINDLINKITKHLDTLVDTLTLEFSLDDVKTAIEIYKQIIISGSEEISDYYRPIFTKIDQLLISYKKLISDEMLKKSQQEKIVNTVEKIISKVNNSKIGKIKSEDDIKEPGKIIQTLIGDNLWPAPGGAWCSSGVPIFDKMSPCGTYPVFKHFDVNGNDVTSLANLDCQSPYYFVYLENGEYNEKIIDYFIKLMLKLQEDYNFDGFRVDHIDHIVDGVSQKNNVPISYRAPALVLKKLNTTLKEKVPHFASLAEYMLWDNYYKEYHIDMNFDILWGNDIICQSSKNPKQIVNDNKFLEEFNLKEKKYDNLSILKTYNNQDGEFPAINQYPGQLTRRGALFKFFMYKFLPGGKNANRPVMFIDGDESFTQKGIESAIGSEISMPRNNDLDFFKEFDAIIRFTLNNKFTNSGKAEIIKQDDDGFVSWIISSDVIQNEALLVVANYNYPLESVIENSENNIDKIVGKNVYNKSFSLPNNSKIIGQIEYNSDIGDFIEISFDEPISGIDFKVLEPSEYKVYKLELTNQSI